MQTIVDGLLINYNRSGKGKTVVLLHGWANSLNDMAPIFSSLNKSFDVISLDLPGFGASQTPKEAWGLNEFSNFLSSFLKKMGAGGIYAFIGHSNGGAIAIKALSSHQLSAEKLVLISSSGIRVNQQGRLGAVKLATKTAKAVSLPLPPALRQKLRKKLYSSLGSDLLAAENMSTSFKKIVSEDIRADAAKIDQPTLIIYGQEDNITPVTYGELFHELIKTSTLEVINGDHFIQIKEPSQVVKLIKDFLC